jgi:hypothetical protein
MLSIDPETVTGRHPFAPFLNVLLDGKDITELGIIEANPVKGYVVAKRKSEGDEIEIVNDEVKTYLLQGDVEFILYKPPNAKDDWWEKGIERLKEMYPIIAKYIRSDRNMVKYE